MYTLNVASYGPLRSRSASCRVVIVLRSRLYSRRFLGTARRVDGGFVLPLQTPEGVDRGDQLELLSARAAGLGSPSLQLTNPICNSGGHQT